jgi:hypothetical protein
MNLRSSQVGALGAQGMFICTVPVLKTSVSGVKKHGHESVRGYPKETYANLDGYDQQGTSCQSIIFLKDGQCRKNKAYTT